METTTDPVHPLDRVHELRKKAFDDVVAAVNSMHAYTAAWVDSVTPAATACAADAVNPEAEVRRFLDDLRSNELGDVMGGLQHRLDATMSAALVWSMFTNWTYRHEADKLVALLSKRV